MVRLNNIFVISQNGCSIREFNKSLTIRQYGDNVFSLVLDGDVSVANYFTVEEAQAAIQDFAEALCEEYKETIVWQAPKGGKP